MRLSFRFLCKHCGCSFNCRKAKERTFMMEHKATVLDILTQNLHPELAQQVQKLWFEPNMLCCQHLLGKGRNL